MKRKLLIIMLVILGYAGILHAQPTQDKAQLEKERQDIQKELQDIQGLYDKVKVQTKQSVTQLNMLNRKISLQESYINNINKELRMIDDDIYHSNQEIYRLQKQYDTLKMQYAHTVVYAYKNRSTYDYLNFIFSASSFNDAIKRVAYLKSYRSYRERQVSTILETEKLIAQRKQQQLGRKVQKNSALENQNKQMSELAIQRKEKDAVLSKLKSQGKDLQKEIATKKKRDAELNNAIQAIIRRAIDAAKKESDAKAALEAKKNAANNTTTTTTNNPSSNTTAINTRIKTGTTNPNMVFNTDADIKLNAGFESNRGRLPWPVDQHFVSIHFGRYDIENTHLTGDNPGITIATPSPGVSAKSVFEGDVVGVFNLGDGMAVTIRHGKYFTTYSNLSSVSVKKGDQVSTGQAIGRVGADDEGGNGGKIDFILMIETKNVNPEVWLRH